MNSTITNKLFDIRDFNEYGPIFIETGLAAGSGVDRALNAGFWIVKSVEAWEPFYTEGKKKYAKEKRVELFFGNSSEMLPEMLKDVDQKAVIFLDSHPAGPGTAGHDDLMEKGAASEFNQDTIITKELQAILKHRGDHTIIIDDQNGSNEDNIAYREMLLAVNGNYKFFWFDEKLNEEAIFYKNKILVAISQ